MTFQERQEDERGGRGGSAHEHFARNGQSLSLAGTEARKAKRLAESALYCAEIAHQDYEEEVRRVTEENALRCFPKLADGEVC